MTFYLLYDHFDHLLDEVEFARRAYGTVYAYVKLLEQRSEQGGRVTIATAVAVTWMWPVERIIHAARIPVDTICVAIDDPQQEYQIARLREWSRAARTLVYAELTARDIRADHNLLLTAGFREELLHLETEQLLLDNVHTATWSPDGQRIAYVPSWNQALGMEERRVLDLATKQSVEIGDTQAHGPITSRLIWTPDRGILLATPHEILAYPDTRIAAPPVTVFAAPATVQVTDDTRIALAPDGRHALIVSGAPHPRLISFVADGTLIKRIEVDYPTAPLWSPDGQRVVVEHAGEFLSIYSAQGELLATSTPEILKLRPLDWSPDGAYLVYSTNGGGTGPFQAYLVQPGGSGSIELAPPFPSTDGISAVLWSPNHRHIAYTVGDYAAVGQEPARTTTYLMLATLANP